MNQYCYNDSLPMWTDYRQTQLSYPNGGAIMTVCEGHISDGYCCKARCRTQWRALRLMRKAGYRVIKRIGKIVQFKA
jgi:hypothetical protein